ncbi:nuclear transport factor 2 family protein [Myxococcota bacterium]|nr:nuclear transport factor 2 family protein [Myxococcota bacterium]
MNRSSDRHWSPEAIRDRFSIEDLYDRQLSAAETHDWNTYDTTFTSDAIVDLSDFGEPKRRYPEYRRWLAALSVDMPKAIRFSGGLRLELEGDRARTRMPVLCCVKMQRMGKLAWTWTALFYNDELTHTAEGWRIESRYEELVFPDGPDA